MNTSKFFRVLWNINAIFIFTLFVFTLLTIIEEKYPLIFKGSTQKHDRGIIVGKKVDIAKELKVNLQHLMYESPEKIKGSDFYLIEIVVIDKEIPTSVKDAFKMANDMSVYSIGAVVNVVFFNEGRTEVHKLLDSYGFIKTCSFPRANNRLYGQGEKPDRNYILYEMGLRDTNKDGRINDKDSTAF